MITITYNGVQLAIPDHPRFYKSPNGCYPCFDAELGNPVEHLLNRPHDDNARQDMIHCAYFYWSHRAINLEDSAEDAACSHVPKDVVTSIYRQREEAITAANTWAKLMEE